MAECIASCKFFIGNQSSPFAVAEQLKVPRIVEVYPQAPNVIPTGGLAYDAYATPNLVHHVNMLIHLSEQK
jgi:ADP-heptose:LPS heptosyltransferase